MIPIVIAALFLFPLAGFGLFTLVVCMFSAWEWGVLAGFASRHQRIWIAMLFGLLLGFVMLAMPGYWPCLTAWKATYTLWFGLVWWTVSLLLVLCYPRSATLWRASRPLRLSCGILTIAPFFWGLLTLRQYHYDINRFTGAWWILYVMILVWSMDSGAYIFGRAWGRHKLAPRVSPGKTWEGVVGGLITSASICWLFGKYAPLEIAPLTLFICSIIAALSSVLGDLSESMFKREAGIKESSYLIPGHGGILDRIDSLTASVPVFCGLMLLIFNAI
ncbi:CDP-diglyceride synthetase [secondary endosymbiont of Ctenarytaina eucalypti]|uniref:Phosphatidate cytidylyltransferase n=2 Tax=secondary endosymbiont of Ctenarytaina eucalypti TaxID=1199245 RepID=J3VTK0_9ENTR|nr:CDP-diglyceride synthetase [secondary endosymbiont of Ctenarytaina eucalypti]